MPLQRASYWASRGCLRATRGHTLTADEQAQLDAWYAAQDVDEAAMLSVATMPDDLRDLQSGVEHVIARILSTSRQIQSW